MARILKYLIHYQSKNLFDWTILEGSMSSNRGMRNQLIGQRKIIGSVVTIGLFQVLSMAFVFSAQAHDACEDASFDSDSRTINNAANKTIEDTFVGFNAGNSIAGFQLASVDEQDPDTYISTGKSTGVVIPGDTNKEVKVSLRLRQATTNGDTNCQSWNELASHGPVHLGARFFISQERCETVKQNVQAFSTELFTLNAQCLPLKPGDSYQSNMAMNGTYNYVLVTTVSINHRNSGLAGRFGNSSLKSAVNQIGGLNKAMSTATSSPTGSESLSVFGSSQKTLPSAVKEQVASDPNAPRANADSAI